MPAWVSALALFQWSEIPGTALSSVEPTAKMPGATGPRSKIETWCGAALKRSGSVYLIGAAGGHTDYAGNEVDALVLNTAKPQWVQLRGPSDASQVINDVQFYLDKRPSATHTYYASHFNESTNRLMVMSSQGVHGNYPPPPANYPYTGLSRSYSFNMATGDWDDPDYIAAFPGSGDHYACFCVQHPITGDIYYSRNYGDGWYQWLAATNRWQKLSSVTRGPWYCGAAIDPVRNRILTVGGYTPSAPAILGLDGSNLNVSFGGLGASALTVSNYPGVVYDEVLNRFFAFFNTADNKLRMLAVDAQTWEVSAPTLRGSEPAARPQGLHNAARYVPELRGIVLANSYNGNVLFMRTSL